jgi:hypothetical protein
MGEPDLATAVTLRGRVAVVLLEDEPLCHQLETEAPPGDVERGFHRDRGLSRSRRHVVTGAI